MPIATPNSSEQPLRVLQITDPHLGDQVGDSLLGQDADHSLQSVIQQIQTNHPVADLLLATGDLSHAATELSYRRFYQLTETLAEQRLWLPGNHDKWPVMQATLGVDAAELRRCADIGRWRIVMINSTVPGEVGGYISPDELAFIEQSLTDAGEQHLLLCLHHHPIDCGSEWLDEQRVSNADALFALLDGHPQVRGLLWGHIHQTLDRQHGQIKLMATPSTCVQFAANSTGFGLAPLNPGYRWLELHEDGRIETSVHRVEGVDFKLDYEYTGGY